VTVREGGAALLLFFCAIDRIPNTSYELIILKFLIHNTSTLQHHLRYSTLYAFIMIVNLSVTQAEDGKFIYEKKIVHDDKKQSLINKLAYEVFMTGDMPLLKGFIISRKSSPVYFFIFLCDVVLRGVSQVFLCDHPITGLLICIGLSLTSIELMLYGLWGTLCGTLGAYFVGQAPIDEISSGLCGYDGALVACAVWAFLDGPNHILCAAAAILSFWSGLFHVSLGNFLKRFSLPPFTFAFNVVMISFLLGVTTGNIGVLAMKPSAPVVIDKSQLKMTLEFLFHASVKGVGQFMFVDTLLGSGLVILGIAISSRSGACAAWLGALVACLTCYYLLQVPESSLVNVRNGLFGYNSAGACAAIAGGVFYRVGPKTITTGAVAAITAVLLLMAFRAFFGTLWELPVLTFPFIVSTWVVMLTESSSVLKPKNIKNGAYFDIIDEIFYYLWLRLMLVLGFDYGNNNYVFSWLSDQHSTEKMNLDSSGHDSSMHSVMSYSLNI